MTFPITDPTWIFFIVLSIILFTPMLLERLRVPAVVGMIFAGILVGPHGGGVLERDGSFELFGKVGLYYIMFLASLEMNLQDVARIKGRALVLGLLGFAVPMALGYWANSAVLGFGVAASVLMAAMYASHTLVAYPIVLRYGLSRLKCVSVAVGGTIVADTLTLLVLAVVGGTFKENATGLYWVWLVAKVVALGLVIVYAFPLVGRWFFRRYDDSVVQYVFVLCLVFLGAGLMEFVGMEGILGAFLVGLVLNRLIPPTSPLMSHIEFVGNALFIPYFLIGVGMLINVRALLEHEGAFVVAGVMVAVGLAGKWIACHATQRIFGMTADERNLMFGLSGARAAATLAVVMVGHNIILPSGERLLGEDVLNGAMALILVTCVVSSMVTEGTARRMAERRKLTEAEAPEEGGGERMLIALSNPETVAPLVNLSLLMRSPGSAVPITAVHIVLEDRPEERRHGLEQLEKAEKLAAAANVRLQTHSRWAVNVVSGISHTMMETDSGDLVIGLHRKARLTEAFFGKLGADLQAGIDRQIIIYKPLMPLNTVTHVQLLIPRKAEFEPGFARCMARIGLLCAQLSCRLDVYGGKGTMRAAEEVWTARGFTHPVAKHEYTSWHDLMPIAHASRRDSMMLFVSARRGTISYHRYLELLPVQIERYFSQRNTLIIYPSQPAGR